MRSSLIAGFTLFRDGFRRDLLILLVATIIVGSLLAAGVAWAVNAYFGDTVAGAIGQFGQYDFIIHVREEAKSAFAKQLTPVIQANLPGAHVKAGMTVAGKANFFVSLPKEYRNRRTMERIDNIFDGLPGFSGHTNMIEPSLVVRGVLPGARPFFISKFQKVPGVAFAFNDSGDITVVVANKSQTEQVEREIKRITNDYKTVEARFPMGYKVKNIQAFGSGAAEDVAKDLKAGVAIDVSGNTSDDDVQSFNNSLVQMRRFLTSYASEVLIYPSKDTVLSPGDELVITGQAARPVARGGALDAKNVHIQVSEVGEGIARGLIVSGDTKNGVNKLPLVKSSGTSETAPPLTSINAAYKVNGNDRVGDLVGPVTIYNQRYQLMNTVDDSIKLLTQLQALATTATATAGRVQTTLDSFDETLARVEDVQSTLTKVNSNLTGPLDGMAKVRTGDIIATLNRAANGIDDMLEKMTGVKEAKQSLDIANRAFSSTRSQLSDGAVQAEGLPATAAGVDQVTGTVNQLGAETASKMNLLDRVVARLNPVAALLINWRTKINATAVQIQNFGDFTKNADAVTLLLKDVGNATDSTLDVMHRLDVTGLRGDIGEISDRMQALSQIDVGAVTKQMAYVKTSLPNLRDDELGRSIRLIDRYIGGEVIPGEHVVFLVNKEVSAAQVGALVADRAGVAKVATVVLPAGTLQPDVRGVLFQILGKVRSTIAGIVALVMVAATLLLDHTLLISALRQTRQRKRNPVAAGVRWSTLANRLADLDVSLLYGGAVGMVLVTTVFVTSGAQIPFITLPTLALIGFGLGLLAAVLASKISPLNSGEFLAAEAIGLSYAEILREVVIPEGRPGLLNLLNRRNMKFPERRQRRDDS